MITKKDIIAMVHHVLRRGAGHIDRQERNPMREWAIGLAITFVLFLCASGFAGYKLFMLMEGDTTVEFQEGSGISYDQESVRQIIETYSNRERNFEQLRMDRSYIVISPSPDETVADDEEEE